MLVVVVDECVSVYPVDRPDPEPLWTRRYPDGATPAILAVDGDRIAVCPSPAAGDVEVLSMSGAGRPVARLAAARSANTTNWPICAMFRGNDLYVVYGVAGRPGPPMDGFAGAVMAAGLSIQKFSPPGQRPLWKRDVNTSPNIAFLSNLPLMAVGAEHLTLLVQTASAPGGEVLILDDKTGEVRQQLDLPAGAAGQYRYPFAPPVMTSGRLCVDSHEGVRVYGGP